MKIISTPGINLTTIENLAAGDSFIHETQLYVNCTEYVQYDEKVSPKNGDVNRLCGPNTCAGVNLKSGQVVVFDNTTIVLAVEAYVRQEL